MTWSSAYNSQPCLQVRVKDVDLERGQLVVRAGKGDKDRVTVLPDRLKAGLQTQLRRVEWGTLRSPAARAP